MAGYKHIVVPKDGKPIKVVNKKLKVPNKPIIPVIEGDGIGRDIMKATRRVVDAAVENDAQVIGLSALLTTTRPIMKRVVEILKERGLHGKIKVLIGGAPVSDEYAKEIGADAYCFDGMKAVDQVKEYLGVK